MYDEREPLPWRRGVPHMIMILIEQYRKNIQCMYQAEVMLFVHICASLRPYSLFFSARMMVNLCAEEFVPPLGVPLLANAKNETSRSVGKHQLDALRHARTPHGMHPSLARSSSPTTPGSLPMVSPIHGLSATGKTRKAIQLAFHFLDPSKRRTVLLCAPNKSASKTLAARTMALYDATAIYDQNQVWTGAVASDNGRGEAIWLDLDRGDAIWLDDDRRDLDGPPAAFSETAAQRRWLLWQVYSVEIWVCNFY